MATSSEFCRRLLVEILPRIINHTRVIKGHSEIHVIDAQLLASSYRLGTATVRLEPNLHPWWWGPTTGKVGNA